MKKIKKCPVRAKEMQAEALQYQSRGSDLDDSAAVTQGDAQPKKTVGRTVLYLMKIVAAVALLFWLREFLPENIRQWYDWFFGDTSKGFSWFSPARMLLCAVLLGLFLLWAFDHRGPKDTDKRL